MDFAENFTIMMSFEIQSAHWISKQVTLFITIDQHLDKICWDSMTSALEKDHEVTVVPADGSEKFWARVVESSPAVSKDEVMVKLVDGKGTKLMRPRQLLRHRKIVSVAHVQVSNDKDHDTWCVQEAMQQICDWYKDPSNVYPGLAERIKSELVRSDGAGSHFKNRTTFHYLGHYSHLNDLIASCV